MNAPRLALVVARGRNGVIGRDGGLPWRLPSDLKRFKAVTWGKPVIMGRRTWESLPKRPLPGRPNFVVSARLEAAPGARLCRDLGEALAGARDIAVETGAEEICVIGGAQLYAAALALADRLYISEVDLAPEGDVVFPPLDAARWRLVEEAPVPAGPQDAAGFLWRVFAPIGAERALEREPGLVHIPPQS